MKKAFLLLALFASFLVDAQSLKEALFSGKLKNEPGTVIRKGDDLSTKMDTVVRKSPARDTLAIITVDQMQRRDSAQARPANAEIAARNTTAAPVAAASAEATVEAEETEPADAEAEPEEKPKPQSNRVLFKDYMTSLAATVKSDIASNKKIKKGTYYIALAYTIGTEGEVTITDLVVDPKQEQLQQLIKARMDADMPTLNPEVNSAGVARKVNRRYNFSIDKE